MEQFKDLFTFRKFNEDAGSKWEDRLSKLYNEFIFGDYKWAFVRKNEHSSTFDLVYECVPLHKKYIQLDIFELFKSKNSNYRQHLEAQFSIFFDITVMNFAVTLIDSMKFKVTMTCVEGSKIFEKVRSAYSRSSSPSAQPLISTNSEYEGTVFPLIECKQFNHYKSYDKGYLLLKFGFDENGELLSDHYDDSSYAHGVPIISLILTPAEYKYYIHRSKQYEGYAMVSNVDELVDTFGCGNESVGKILLWIGILVDIIGSIEHWTFNQAYDDPCILSTIRGIYLYKNPNDNSIMIVSNSTVSGIMSEGVEALIMQDPRNAVEDVIRYSISFCNGIEDVKTHSENVKRMTHVIFDNLFNDTCSFGWKLGNPTGNIYTGLLCVSDDITYTESRDTRYVRNVKVQATYHAYYFCPDKKTARILRYRNRYQYAFGHNFKLSQLMYPIKKSNNIVIYKSYSKNASKKFNYVALVSVKDYQNGAASVIQFLKGLLESDSYRVDIFANRTFDNPLCDGFCYDLIEEYLKPYIKLDNIDTCYTTIGKRMVVLETLPFEP